MRKLQLKIVGKIQLPNDELCCNSTTCNERFKCALFKDDIHKCRPLNVTDKKCNYFKPKENAKNSKNL